MLKARAACAAATRWFLAVATGTVLMTSAAQAEWNEPWKDEDRALVIDAYEFNPIEWNELVSDKRIAGFINKASDGLPPAWSCKGLSGDDERLCKNRWWKYSVTQELYFTRRQMAKSLGLKWGAYHLARPGNPREQADHFIDFAKPEADELVALDIEDNDPQEWMSLADAEIFAEQIKIRIGRYPVLYTNGSTAEYIAKNKETYPLLARLPLWYARYRDDITGMFPEETWPSYALWQFSSMHNCGTRSCPYRVKGAKTDIDVNVSPLTVADLKAAWPFSELVGDGPAPDVTPDDDLLVASISEGAKSAVASIVEEPTATDESAPNVATPDEAAEARDMMLAAYAPDETSAKIVDPLELLTQAAREEHRAAEQSPILSALTDRGRKIDPDMPDAAAPKLRAYTMPTHAVDIGMMNAAGLLKKDMDRVRQILRTGPVQALPVAPAGAVDETVELVTPEKHSALSPEATARSRIAEKLRAAKRGGALIERAAHRAPAVDTSSSLSQPLRGERLRATAQQRRIVEAFGATE